MFAEHGFRAATIREICGRAGVNIAAVNYHFRDKEGLYESVLKYAHRHALETYPPQPPAGEAGSARGAAAGVYSFVSQTHSRSGAAGLARQAHGPRDRRAHGGLGVLVEQSIRPLQEVLLGIIRELVGPGCRNRAIRLCAISVVGQCMHFYLARPVLQRLNPELKYSPEDLEMMAEHVTGFSLAAIRNLLAEGQNVMNRVAIKMLVGDRAKYLAIIMGIGVCLDADHPAGGRFSSAS